MLCDIQVPGVEFNVAAGTRPRAVRSLLGTLAPVKTKAAEEPHKVSGPREGTFACVPQAESMTSVVIIFFYNRNARVPEPPAQGNDLTRTTFHIDRATWDHHEKRGARLRAHWCTWQVPLGVSRCFCCCFAVASSHMCGSRCGFLGDPERVCRLRRPGRCCC